MKNHYSGIFKLSLLTLILVIHTILPEHIQAQKNKQSKSARRAAEKAEQIKLNQMEYQRVLTAFNNNRWAFETPQLMDQMGMPIIGENRPNVVGFNGEELEALVIYKYEQQLRNQEKPDIQYKPVHHRGNVLKQEHHTDKKGRLIYKYVVAHPFNGSVTVTLMPDTSYGEISLNPAAGPVQYQGKFMPISDCWYYLKVDEGKKKK